MFQNLMVSSVGQTGREMTPSPLSLSSTSTEYQQPRLSGESIVTKDKSDKIKRLDVRRCQAFRKKDKEYVLARIEEYTNIEAFNANLRTLLGGMVLYSLYQQQRIVERYEEKNTALEKQLEQLIQNQVESDRQNMERIKAKQERIEQLERELASCKNELAAKNKAEQESKGKWWFQM